MLSQIDITQAKTNLSELIEEVLRGEEVVITRDNQPVVKLVAISPVKQSRSSLFGSDQGIIAIFDDFDEPLEDFKEYME